MHSGGQSPKSRKVGGEERIDLKRRLLYRTIASEKTSVKKDNADPFFAARAEASGTHPTWKFHKFLIGRDGLLISDYSPRTQPYDDKLVAAIEQALAK